MDPLSPLVTLGDVEQFDGQFNDQFNSQFDDQFDSQFIGQDTQLVPGPAIASATLQIPLVDRPYHAKRPHKKSRAGCHNCKHRKVKCDEARPRCRACTLRKESCVYPETAQSSSASSTAASRTARAAAASAFSSASAVPASSASPLSSSSGEESMQHHSGFSRDTSPLLPSNKDIYAVARQTRPMGVKRRGWQGKPGFADRADGFGLLEEPLFRPMQFDATDMKLLWFYTAKGFDAFSAEAGRQPKVDEALQITIPRHAFASPFLMDCLLALSALELKMLNQPIEAKRVLTYRARAFAGYRKAVETATPEVYPALLACSLLLCALSSQMFRDPESSPLYILDWMVVWRGIGLVVKLINPSVLFESGMSLLFARPPINLDASTKYIPNHLLFLVSSIGRDDPDFAYIDLYYETLKYLGSLYRELDSGLGRILNLRTITWFTFLPKGFVSVAREHRPRALIIIAHYLVFVKLCRRLWWMQGIADKEIKDIQNVLDDAWQSFLIGPLSALETEDEVEIGKILLNNNNWTPDYFYDPVRDSAKELSLVDNSGHKIVYNGAWVVADTGEAPVWNLQDDFDSSVSAFRPDEILLKMARSDTKTPTSSRSPENTADINQPNFD